MFRIEDGALVPESEAESQTFFSKEGLVHFICLKIRPGVSDCLLQLEHKHYEPGTERNTLFSFRYLEWENLLWYIVSIPAEEKDFMDKAAIASGLRVDDGVPVMYSTGKHVFPVTSKAIFTLVNIPGHPIYSKKSSPL